ncbi:MAG TPA: HNH endonuclease family protein [Actinophytocola sp.]|uniref:HNH endonuclease family protein n=1 Tax=Actinophytocola sp. TaxID=1872138 RepID=UPI002F948CB3
MTRIATLPVLAAVLAAAVLAPTACKPVDLTTPATTGPAGPATPATPPPANAAALLRKLPVAEEDTGAHYERAEWGEDWPARTDGCTTRDLVLLRQAKGAQRGAGCALHCPAAKPCWVSPYDGRATADPGELEIDHRVPLNEAARSRVVAGGKPGLGATRVWSAAQKHAYYADPANLVAVTAEVNSAKSDDDPARWRPANREAWCAYATRYIQTKLKYHLTADKAERAALAQMLGTCPAK